MVNGLHLYSTFRLIEPSKCFTGMPQTSTYSHTDGRGYYLRWGFSVFPYLLNHYAEDQFFLFFHCFFTCYHLICHVSSFDNWEKEKHDNNNIRKLCCVCHKHKISQSIRAQSEARSEPFATTLHTQNGNMKKVPSPLTLYAGSYTTDWTHTSTHTCTLQASWVPTHQYTNSDLFTSICEMYVGFLEEIQ